MECGGQSRPTGQNEFSQRFQLFQQSVDYPLHFGDVFLFDSRNLNLQWAGQVGADYEKLILNLAERVVQLLIGQTLPRDSQQRIQFVDVAVGGDARISLANAASVDQRRFAGVAAPSAKPSN